ncbi:serine carboxypeptidase II-2-like [Ipomoea triloba]|uniref:serine carboxypeptidase II-2-like n=1 Tax=Ipomoea triloba TaxID=35885 RepID=UPI00125CF322|nr:serine carboxypeptidase II-2-like [Ipomoea triloba]
MTKDMKLSILVFLLIFLTKFEFICSKGRHEQKKQDKISSLPGQNFLVNFSHYAGYVTVNEEQGKEFFYWFIQASHDPSSKPLALWLNGGPGCSAIAFGEAEEIGPFHINPDGKSVYLNSYAWNQVANIIFLDSPAGVGFSYANSTFDFSNQGDQSTAEDNLKFLLKWLERFPEYKQREFYIIGESYAGHFVPQLSKAILEYNSENEDNSINLKGFMIGNPLVDDHHDQVGISQFMWTLGLISDQSYEMLNLYCANDSYLNASEECDNAHSVAAEEIGDIDYYSVFTPVCTTAATTLAGRNWLTQRWLRKSRSSRKYDPCTEKYAISYFNQLSVQKALHVRGAPINWETCNNEVHYKWKDSAGSVLPTIKELTGIRKWVLSGDTDAVIPITSTRYSIDALHLPTVGPWRTWDDDGQVGGWTQEYEGVSFVTVRGGGHEVPLHKPKQALAIFKSFLAGEQMPSFQQLSNDI